MIILHALFVTESLCSYLFNGTGEIGTRNDIGFAPKNVGVHFSVETEYSPKPWGVHHAWPYTHGKDWWELLKSCPEIMLIKPFLSIPVHFPPCLPGR